MGRAPSLRVIPWHLPYNWGKKHGKTSVRVAEECQLARWKQNIQNRTYITIRIQKHNNKNKGIQNILPYIQWLKNWTSRTWNVLATRHHIHAGQPLVDLGTLIIEVSKSHSDTPHSVGLLWTSDQLVAETSTWRHTTLTRDRHPRRRRDSKPQS